MLSLFSEKRSPTLRSLGLQIPWRPCLADTRLVSQLPAVVAFRRTPLSTVCRFCAAPLACTSWCARLVFTHSTSLKMRRLAISLPCWRSLRAAYLSCFHFCWLLRFKGSSFRTTVWCQLHSFALTRSCYCHRKSQI